MAPKVLLSGVVFSLFFLCAQCRYWSDYSPSGRYILPMRWFTEPREQYKECAELKLRIIMEAPTFFGRKAKVSLLSSLRVFLPKVFIPLASPLLCLEFANPWEPAVVAADEQQGTTTAVARPYPPHRHFARGRIALVASSISLRSLWRYVLRSVPSLLLPFWALLRGLDGSKTSLPVELRTLRTRA
jgi:hypothetical protein